MVHIIRKTRGRIQDELWQRGSSKSLDERKTSSSMFDVKFPSPESITEEFAGAVPTEEECRNTSSMRETIEKSKRIQSERKGVSSKMSRRKDDIRIFLVCVIDAIDNSREATYKGREDFIVESLGKLYNEAKEIREELGMGDSVPPSSRGQNYIVGYKPKTPGELQEEVDKRIATEVSKQLSEMGISNVYVGVDLSTKDRGRVATNKQTEVEKIREQTELIKHHAKLLRNKGKEDGSIYGQLIPSLIIEECEAIEGVAFAPEIVNNKAKRDSLAYRVLRWIAWW